MPVRAVAEKVTRCQCGTWNNKLVTDDIGSCWLVPCETEIEKKHIYCRPCTKGNHTGEPCLAPTRDPYFPIVKTCNTCGVDLSLHKVGTNGELNG